MMIPNENTVTGKKTGHGTVAILPKAIEQSCDVYFYELAYRSGIDKMHTNLWRGSVLVSATGIDLLGERRGLLPSTEWKKRVHMGTVWYPRRNFDCWYWSGLYADDANAAGGGNGRHLASRGEKISADDC